jgi:Fe-S-cluster containining protein
VTKQPDYSELCFDDRFRFFCGPHLSCFVECCRGTRIWLYPFDVLRISRSLGLSTGAFLDRFCCYYDEDGPGYPILLLRSADEGRGRCPFAQDPGCTIYPDRPWICRLFPVSPRECRTDRTPDEERRFSIVEWEGCRGVRNGPEVSIREWFERSGTAIYDETYLDWQDLTLGLREGGRLPLTGAAAELFKLGSYDPDRLLDELATGNWQQELPLTLEELTAARHDDLALLALSCRWLHRVLPK